jgi:hypothetical protein
MQNKPRPWLTVLAYVVVFHLLLAYGLPTGALVVLAVALGWWYRRLGAVGSVAATVALLAVTLFYSLALTVTGFENAIYFRPDERLSTFNYDYHHRIFQPGAQVDMQMPHGDLQSMTDAKIAQPRRVIYHIDTYGFRNDRDYHGQKYVLVGDSFVAGTGNTQADILSAQLLRDYHIDAYNLAHPGDVPDYARYVAGFKARGHRDIRVLLFIFEGNDFVQSRDKPQSPVSLFIKRYANIFSGTNVFRVTKSLIARATHTSAISRSELVTVATLQGQRVGLLKEYVDVSRRASQPTIASFDRALLSMRGELERVYFVPTKYRVYHQHLAPTENLPHAAWSYLHAVCEKEKLPCTDLTPALTRAADAALVRGELLWWRDDTHWNATGIAAAAQAVAASLGGTAQEK